MSRPSSRYWCYRCSRSVNAVYTDGDEFVSCPICEGGFMEEIEVNDFSMPGSSNLAQTLTENGSAMGSLNLLENEHSVQLPEVIEYLDGAGRSFNSRINSSLSDFSLHEHETTHEAIAEVTITGLHDGQGTEPLQPPELLMDLDGLISSLEMDNTGTRLTNDNFRTTDFATGRLGGIQAQVEEWGGAEDEPGDREYSRVYRYVPPPNRSASPLDISASQRAQASHDSASESQNQHPQSETQEPSVISNPSEPSLTPADEENVGNRFAQYLQQLIQRRVGPHMQVRLGLPRGPFFARNPSNFFASHPGDYLDARGLEEFLLYLASEVDSREGAPPASKAAVEALPVVTIEQGHIKSEFSSCAICKEAGEVGVKALQLPCKHLYHADCIKPWLEIRNSCPVCRFELPTDDPDYEQQKGSPLPTQHPQGDELDVSNMDSNERIGVDGTVSAMESLQPDDGDTEEVEAEDSGNDGGNSVRRMFQILGPMGQLAGVVFVIFIGHRFARQSLLGNGDLPLRRS